MTQIKTLRPVSETVSEYDRIEFRILKTFRELLYGPLLKELGARSKKIQNAKKSPLIEAITEGRVTFSRGTFSGKLNAAISKELKAIGATWDKKTKTFKAPYGDLPGDIRSAVTLGNAKFKERIEKIGDRIEKIDHAGIAGKINVADLFEAAILQTDNDLTDSLKSVSIVPKLTKAERKRISDEWQKNLELYIEDFSKTKMLKLRKDIYASVMSGNRYEDVVSAIEDSYEVTRSKAKFLARQETGLMMAKLRQVRYQAAGINEYKWGTRQDDRVRKSHKALEGKIFLWDTPPITTDPDEHPTRRCNPGQDYNCRCIAKPVVRFKGK